MKMWTREDQTAFDAQVAASQEAVQRISVTSEEEAHLLRHFFVQEVTTLEEVEALYAESKDDEYWEETFAEVGLDTAKDIAKALSVVLVANPFAFVREALTEVLLNLSLCPIHRIDYAICFDDQAYECAAVRHIHPSHDS